jgi:hypothetical protein
MTNFLYWSIMSVAESSFEYSSRLVRRRRSAHLINAQHLTVAFKELIQRWNREWTV